MTVLASTINKPLRAQMADDLRRPLATLFAGYEAPWAKGDAEAVLSLRDAQAKVYMLALNGLPEWAVQEAVTAFVQGRVERSNRAKLPTAEQIAAEARRLISEEAQRQQRSRAEQEARDEARERAEFEANRTSREERAAAAARIRAEYGLQPMSATRTGQE